MILTARLFIEGHPTEQEGIPLLTCQFSFNQEIDQKGMPVSLVKAGIIDFSFSSINDSDIIWWMLSAAADKNGKIVFSGIESSKPFKTLAFKDARCIKYFEKFERDKEMTIEMTISAREIDIADVTYANFWSGYEKQ